MWTTELPGFLSSPGMQPPFRKDAALGLFAISNFILDLGTGEVLLEADAPIAVSPEWSHALVVYRSKVGPLEYGVQVLTPGEVQWSHLELGNLETAQSELVRGEAADPTERVPEVQPFSRTQLDEWFAEESEDASLTRSYTIWPGDTLFGIAQRELGDGSLWPRILELNPALQPNNLRVGSAIELPADN